MKVSRKIVTLLLVLGLVLQPLGYANAQETTSQDPVPVGAEGVVSTITDQEDAVPVGTEGNVNPITDGEGVVPVGEIPEGDGENAVTPTKVVTGFQLDNSVLMQETTVGSEYSVNLPTKVMATYNLMEGEALKEENLTEEVEVTWSEVEGKAFGTEVEGSYSYIGYLVGRYELTESAILPSVTVAVTPPPTLKNERAESADGNIPASLRSEVPAPIAEEPLNVISSIPIYDGTDSSLWEYTTDLGTDNGYTVIVNNAAITNPATRSFTVDINPYDVQDFPFIISTPTTQQPFSVSYDGSDKTKVIYQTTSTAAFAGEFDIRLSMASGFEYTNYYNSGSGGENTVAGAIGHTLLNNTVTPKFGVKVEFNDGTEIHKYEKEHKLDIPTSTADYDLIGETVVVNNYGTVQPGLSPYITKDENDGIGGLWLASDGNIYFKTEAGYLIDGYSLRTALNTADHAPIGNFTYQYAVPEKFAIRGFPDNYFESQPYAKGKIGYTNDESVDYGVSYGRSSYDYQSSLFTNLSTNQADMMEGSLVSSASLKPYIYRPLSVSSSYSQRFTYYLYDGQFTMAELMEEGMPEYYTVPSGSASTITYDIYTSEGVKSKTYTFDKEMVINIPDYTYVDRMTTEAEDNNDDGQVEIYYDTTELEFKLYNGKLSDSELSSDYAVEPYKSGVVTLNLPTKFDATTLEVDDYYSGRKIYDSYQVFIGEEPQPVVPITSGEDEDVDPDISIPLPDGATRVEFKIIEEGNDPSYNQTFTLKGAMAENHGLNGDDGLKIDLNLTTSEGAKITGTNDEDIDPVWVYKEKDLPTHNVIFEVESIDHHNEQSALALLGSDKTTGWTVYLHGINNEVPAQSLVYDNAKFEVVSEEPSHIELIREVLFQGTMHVPDGAEINIYYTTDKNPTLQVEKASLKYGENRFFVPDDEKLTSLYILYDKLQHVLDEPYIKVAPFMAFKFSNERLTPEELGLSATDTEGVFKGNFQVNFTSDNGGVQTPNDDNYFKYSTVVEEYEEPRVIAHQIPDQAIVSSEKLEYSEGYENKPEDMTIGYDSGLDMEGIGFPQGSAVYLKLNNQEFAYIGTDPRVTQLNVKSNMGETTDVETWMRYDISGLGGAGEIKFGLDDFRVKGIRNDTVSLFLDAYVDLGPILAADPEDMVYTDYQLGDKVAISLPNLTDASDITYYGEPISHEDVKNGRLVQIIATEGKELKDYKVSIYGSVVTTVIAYPKVENILGTVPDGEGAKATVEYYAHESDDLFVDITASRSLNFVDYNLTITLPDDDMDLRFDGDVLSSLPEDWKTLGATVTYYDKVGDETDDVTQAKAAMINVKNLPKSDLSTGDPEETKTASKNLSIPIKASEIGVYEKGVDGSISTVQVTFSALDVSENKFESAEPFEVIYKFKWYELSGVAFAEKAGEDDGIYDDRDRYLTATEFRSEYVKLDNVMIDPFVYDQTTGEYSVKLQPRKDQYVFTFIPSEVSELNISTKLPTQGTLDGNNNYPDGGIKFNANIEHGFGPIAGDSGNLKQQDFDNGMVDIGVVYAERMFTVIFEDILGNESDASKTDEIAEVLEDSTISATTVTPPDMAEGGSVEGWYIDKNLENEWNFKYDKVTDNITLYPKVIYPVTFVSPEEGDNSKIDRVENGKTTRDPGDDWYELDEGQGVSDWYEDKDGSGDYSEGDTPWDFATVITKPITLVPKVETVWTVIFEKADGFTEHTRQIVKDGEFATEIKGDDAPDGEVEGLKPLGWFIDKDNDEIIDEGESIYVFTTPVISNITLTPYYDYHVIFYPYDKNDTTIKGTPSWGSDSAYKMAIKDGFDDIVNDDEFPTIAEPEGYLFDKWVYYDADGNAKTFTASTNVAHGTEIYPLFTVAITITFNAGEDSDTLEKTENNQFTIFDNNRQASVVIKTGGRVKPSPITTPNVGDSKVFEFWFKDIDGDGEYKEEIDAIFSTDTDHTENTTYLAHYGKDLNDNDIVDEKEVFYFDYFYRLDGNTTVIDYETATLKNGGLKFNEDNDLVALPMGGYNIEDFPRGYAITGWKFVYSEEDEHAPTYNYIQKNGVDLEVPYDVLNEALKAVEFNIDKDTYPNNDIYIEAQLEKTNTVSFFIVEEGTDVNNVNSESILGVKSVEVPMSESMAVPSLDSFENLLGESFVLPNGKELSSWNIMNFYEDYFVTLTKTMDPAADFNGKNPREDMMFIAFLQPVEEHKVEFDKDGDLGGTIHETKDNIPDKDTVTLPDDNNPMTGKGKPDKWTTEPNGGGSVWEFDDPTTPEKEGTPVVEDVILYPYWTPEITNPGDSTDSGTAPVNPPTGGGNEGGTTPPATDGGGNGGNGGSDGPIILPPVEIPDTEDGDDEGEEEDASDEEEDKDEEEDEADLVIPPITDDSSFDKVEVDGNELDEDDYTIDEDGNLIIKLDYIETLPDGEHVVRVESDGEVYEAILVVDDGVPTSMGVFERIGGAWSLFDLIMTILAVVFAIGYTIIRPRKRKEDEEEEADDEEEEEKKHKKRILTSGVLALLAIFNIILFIITQDLTQPMIIFDIYSIIFALVVIAQVVIMFFIRKKNDEEDDDEEQVTSH